MSSNYCYPEDNSIPLDHNPLLWFLWLGLKIYESFVMNLVLFSLGHWFAQPWVELLFFIIQMQYFLSVSWIGTKWSWRTLVALEFSCCRTHSTICTYYWFSHSGHIAKMTDIADFTLNLRQNYYLLTQFLVSEIFCEYLAQKDADNILEDMVSEQRDHHSNSQQYSRLAL